LLQALATTTLVPPLLPLSNATARSLDDGAALRRRCRLFGDPLPLPWLWATSSDEGPTPSSSSTSSAEPSAASNGGASSSGSSPKRKPVVFIERKIGELVDVLLLPFRHTVVNVNLWAMKFAFPGSWDANEFWTGAPEAFRMVTELLDVKDRDVRPLQGLISEQLLEELREASSAPSAPDAPQVTFSEVLDARLLGIFTVRMRVDSATGGAMVHVTVLIGATEEYLVGEDEEKWHVKRIHKWKFKRDLPSEEGEALGDWQIIEINKKRWQPPPGVSTRV